MLQSKLDQDSLPPYDVLDAILEGYVEKDLSVNDLIKLGFDKEMVRKVVRLVDINEYKRRQAPIERVLPCVILGKIAVIRSPQVLVVKTGHNRDYL